MSEANNQAPAHMVSGLKEAIEAGAALSALKMVAPGRPAAVLPEGYKVHDLESYMPQPARARGSITLRDADSFIRYINEMKGDATRLFYVIEPAPRFQAVLNDHKSQEKLGWGDMIATYICPLSKEWRAWADKDGHRMNQVEFAQFLESNLPDIAIPPAADMLEVALTLQAKKKVNFASGVRLSNGEHQLTYEEQIEGSAGAKGKMEIPEMFTLGIPVFEGGPKYALDARLRYRIEDGEGKRGNLSMWYELVRPHKLIEDAVAGTRNLIEQSTGLTAFNGGYEKR